MHYKTVKGILHNNGMNLYRGCSHGCIYCDSRSACYQMDHPFEDIEVKENALDLLEIALMRKKKKCMIGMGSMTDPYIPLEAQLMHTRKSLLLAEKYGFGVTLITKSNLILRDLDILERINKKTKAVVQITLTTFDEELCKKLEPNVSTTQERVEVLKRCHERGIPTVVWLCPFLPFINDTEENLRGLLNYCAEAKVTGILFFGIGLTLRTGNREYFYQKLDQLFPGLKEKYIAAYHDNYNITSPNSPQLSKIVQEVCQQHDIMFGNQAVFNYLSEFPLKYEQLKLF